MEVSSWHDLTGRVFLAAGSGAVSPRGGGKGPPGRHAPGVGSGAWWRWGQAAQPLRVCSFNVEKRHLVHFIEEALRPNTVPSTALTFSPPRPHFHQPPVQGRTGLLSTQMFAVFLKKEMLVSRYISSLKLEA